MEALLARVEQASGPNTHLDCDLHAALAAQIPKGYARGSASGSYIIAHHKKGGIWTEKVPPYTASIDAIVELIERELPGWAWKVVRDYARGNCCVVVRNAPSLDIVAPAWVHTSPTVPLALCGAFLRARIAMERQS
jgi:hypothetical protein